MMSRANYLHIWFVCQGPCSAETKKIIIDSKKSRDLEFDLFQSSHLLLSVGLWDSVALGVLKEAFLRH